jgi:hypothetical protein
LATNLSTLREDSDGVTYVEPTMIHEKYNRLGINQLFSETYSEDNVLKLENELIFNNE